MHDVSLPAPDWHLHVVDDDAPFRRSLVFLLESMGWQVTPHASAADFLAACPSPQDTFGCLLLDIRMPQMSGLELLRALVSRGWNPEEIPVIFLTGHGDVELAVQAMKQGAFDFLEKPFRDQHLLDVIGAALRQRAAALHRGRRTRQAHDALTRLSPRESEVARLVARGLPNRAIAQTLDISEKTVHIHRQRVMDKLDIGSAAELARIMFHADPEALDD
ncbi:response regulator transcription factor [Brachymonas sp.]|uniref:response regulator transcription factor n=1 Tax=unclassified Brachymonas TaxID=2621329 RepID=UPI0035B1E8AF